MKCLLLLIIMHFFSSLFCFIYGLTLRVCSVITRLYTFIMQAYFPSISQPEGLPLKVQDAKGKEWIFQFRFWPNNNSRMYVLEGVTPCIQSMQLQAGDTGKHTIRKYVILISNRTPQFVKN